MKVSIENKPTKISPLGRYLSKSSILFILLHRSRSHHIVPSQVMLATVSPPVSNRESARLQACKIGKRRVTFLVIFILTVVFLCRVSAASRDPYEVLGVRRDATSDQIKRAYRSLARELHPDKSNTSGDDDDSELRFIELNKAFEILKDPDKRRRYDQFGDANDNSRRAYSGGGAYSRSTRGGWTAPNGFQTHTSSSFDSYYRRKSITRRQYNNDFLAASKQQPFLVLFYGDICPACSRIESPWVELTVEMAKYNVDSFTVNIDREARLAHELGVKTTPHVAFLLDAQLHPYHQRELTLPSIVRFIKNALPNNLVPLLKTVEQQDRHIALAPQLNRLSAIIISNEKALKLRYLLMAYATRHYYKFGFVSTRLSEYKALFNQYNLKHRDGVSIILVFNERHDRPTLHLEFHPDKFNTSKFIDRLLARPHLKLPKLSSQQRFDDLCLYARPVDGDRRVSPPLCVVLFASATPTSQAHRDRMLEFVELNNFERDPQLAFAYLDPDKQDLFAQAILHETQTGQPGFVKDSLSSSVLLLQRHDTDNRKAHYQWLSVRWNARQPDELDRAKVELHQYVLDYKLGLFRPKNKTLLGALVDEDGSSLSERLYVRALDCVEQIVQYLTPQESISAITILVACVVMTSLFFYKSPLPGWHARDARHPSDHNKSQTSSQPVASYHRFTSPEADADELKIIELKAETYNGMLRLLKPGFRSIILLTDQANREKLVAKFRRCVSPYRLNKTLLFGYLCLDKNLPWYENLLKRILGWESLNVNKKNCIGTVLSLNGFKQYLHVYHAKHHEIGRHDDQNDNNGSFLGFNRDDCGHQGDLEHAPGHEPGDVTYTADNLLDGLPNWLDRMFDGLAKRYFLDQWPEEIK